MAVLRNEANGSVLGPAGRHTSSEPGEQGGRPDTLRVNRVGGVNFQRAENGFAGGGVIRWVGPSATVGVGRDGGRRPSGDFGVFFAVEGLSGGGDFWLLRDGGFHRDGRNGLGFRLRLAALDGFLERFERGSIGAFVGGDVALDGGEGFLGGFVGTSFRAGTSG